jgi:diacylglycerol kinase family enzyme
MARHLYGATLSCLRRRGATAVIVETASHGEGMKTAAEAALSGRFDAVVAAGGDGTAHDAAEGLIGYSTPLGILPLGTGNVFARELNLALTRGPYRTLLLRVRTDRGEAQAQWVIVTRIKHYADGLILVPQADLYQPFFYVLRLAGSGPFNRIPVG